MPGALIIPLTPEFSDNVPKILYRNLVRNEALPTEMQKDGVPLYFDKDHLTLTGARLLRPEMDRIVADAISASATTDMALHPQEIPYSVQEEKDQGS